MSEKKKLLGSDKSKINKDQSGENMPYLEATKVVLIYCYIDNDEYQQILESCIHLVLINHLVNYCIFNSKFSSIEIWFTDKNFKFLVIEDKINITLVINSSAKYQQKKALFSST